jgi:SAM-dependent methyltransferase
MKKSLRWRVAQYFESHWWSRYLKKKDVKTYLAWKKEYWRDLLDKLSPSIAVSPDQYMLDAGCGPAGIFIYLPGDHITAFDPLLDTYEQNLPHFKRSMYPNITFYNAPLEEFQTEQKFDLVFCMNAINHVSQIDEAFVTLYNATKKGGKLVVSIDAHNHRFYKFISRLQQSDILHPHQYDLNEYKQMLTKLDCTILQTSLQKKEFLFNHYVLVAQKN